MLELNKVHHGDCLELMRLIPDKSIDLVLTDPPYGIGVTKMTLGNGKNKIYRGEEEWDNKIPDKEYFDEIFRISKNQIIRGGNYFVKYLEGKMCWLVWDKCTGDNDFSDCELAYTSFNKALRKYTESWVGANAKDTHIRHHPTQKPVKLMKRCLENYSEPGMTILDPFLGSGTTAIACKELGRNFIGIEKEKKYVDIANKRLATTSVGLFN